MPLALPKSKAEISAIQAERKRLALLQARKAPFYAGKLEQVNPERLDDPEEWRKIPILTKDELRGLTDDAFYRDFCLPPADGIAEYWRSGGATGRPLFYPRSFTDIRYAILSFARTLRCTGCASGQRAHLSFPLGIHPAGQIYGRAATDAGLSTTWAGAGTTTPSALQLDLIQRLKPDIWLGMSSYALHLASLAETAEVDLKQNSVETVICSAEPLSDAKRAKIARSWGARVFDTFGMTEAGMMGAEDGYGGGFRIWSDMYYCEVVDPENGMPVPPGQTGCFVVTPLWTNTVTPFLRWNSGDLVTMTEADDGSGPFSVFPLVKHAHRTSGFFKVRGININHAEFEDFMFAIPEVGDFKCEAVASNGLDALQLSVEFRAGTDPSAGVAALAECTKIRFELTPDIIVLEPGTIARLFEASVKAPRFLDRR